MSNVLSKMPNIAIPRSRFRQPFNHSTSFYHGKLIPIDCFEVLPGDNYSLTLSSLIRMSTPIAPIMGNIECYLHAFFVPMRLIWDDAEKFYGDPSNHGKISSIIPVDPDSVVVPNWKPKNTAQFSASDFAKSVSAYLGKPFISSGMIDNTSDLFISCLKERGYLLIWNEYFRPSNLIAPILIDKTSGYFAIIGTLPDGTYFGYYNEPLSVCKKYDYFTSATLSPQFGDSVSLPLGTFAPVITRDVDATGQGTSGWSSSKFKALEWMDSSGYKLTYPEDDPSVTGFGIRVGFNRNSSYDAKSIAASSSSDVNFYSTIAPKNQWADLSAATAATINSIRYAFQVQKYLERSNYGSHFFEILNAHYGTTSPDGRLQRPDRLGYHKFYINVSQVLATATGTDGTGSSQLGQTGAVSVTGDKVHLFDAAFTEPGYIYILLDTKFDRSYSGGLLREDKRQTRFEFYSPEFANLGDQSIAKNELAIFSNFNSSQYFDDAQIFGFQEHWAEYRYRKDRVSGILNPTSTAQSGVSNLAFWTLSDVFDSIDSNNADLSLQPSFLYEDRVALARALATGSSGPDYIADFHFDYLATRELPLYSIPGLIDHFGAL